MRPPLCTCAHPRRRYWPSENPPWVEGYIHDYEPGTLREHSDKIPDSQPAHAALTDIAAHFCPRLTFTAESGTHSILYDPNQPGRETVEDSYSFAEATAVRLGGARRDDASRLLKSLYGGMHRRVCGFLSRTLLDPFQPLSHHTHISWQADFVLGEFVDLRTMVGSRRVADRPQDAILPTNPALDAGFTTPSSGTGGLVVWVHGC